jgi:hypothetical protein
MLFNICVAIVTEVSKQPGYSDVSFDRKMIADSRNPHTFSMKACVRPSQSSPNSSLKCGH